eukprot:8371486-Heterocapsa_arctica.AAC.1
MHIVCSLPTQLFPGNDPPRVRTNPDAWGLYDPPLRVTAMPLALFCGRPIGTKHILWVLGRPKCLR